MFLLMIQTLFGNSPGEILDENDWSVLSKYLEPHMIFTLKWPSENDIKNHCPEKISKSVKQECLSLIKEILNPEILPPDLEQRLIPMKSWGRPTKDYIQKGGSDLFICTWEKDPIRIQIWDANDNMYIIAENDKNNFFNTEKHLEYAQSLYKEILSKIFQRSDIREFKNIKNDLTQGSWLFNSFINMEATRNRITGVQFMTNARFVLFVLNKADYSPVNPDPYKERFKAPPSRTERLQKLSPEIRKAFEKEDYEALKTLARGKDDNTVKRVIYELVKTYPGQKIILELIETSEQLNIISDFDQAFYFQNRDEDIGIDPAVHKRLVQLLDHDSERTRYIAACILGKIKDPNDVDVLIKKYHTETKEFARSGIIIALINMEDKRTLPVLEDVSKNVLLGRLRESAMRAIEKMEKKSQLD